MPKFFIFMRPLSFTALGMNRKHMYLLSVVTNSLQKLNKMDMSMKFIIRTVLESLLVILIIIGFIRERKLINYEIMIHQRLIQVVKYCQEILSKFYYNKL